MAEIDLSVQYTLTAPGGTKASFNNPSDTDFVGYLTEIAGLDSADVRENAQDRVAGDGGIHGNFYRGRRAVSLAGFIYATFPISARNAAQNKLEAAVDALRRDGTLVWTPSGGAAKLVNFRLQQPCRVTDSIPKKFVVGLVSAEHRVVSNTLNSVAATLGAGAMPLAAPTVTNAGNADGPVIFKITGPVTAPVVSNSTKETASGLPNARVTFNQNVPSGRVWTVTIDATGYTVLDDLGTKHDDAAVPTTTFWDDVLPGGLGNTSFLLSGSGTSAATALQVQWRDAWV